MAVVGAHRALRAAMKLLLVVGVLHATQHTISLAEARDCGCIPSSKWVCGSDGKYYSSLCQAMCDGVSGGANNGECGSMNECELGCLARTLMPIKPGSPDYCTPICWFPPYPPLGYNVRRDGPDVCFTYRRQCGAVCAATRLNPAFGFKKSDDFMNKCFAQCVHHVGCSIWDKGMEPKDKKK